MDNDLSHQNGSDIIAVIFFFHKYRLTYMLFGFTILLYIRKTSLPYKPGRPPTRHTHSSVTAVALTTLFPHAHHRPSRAKNGPCTNKYPRLLGDRPTQGVGMN